MKPRQSHGRASIIAQAMLAIAISSTAGAHPPAASIGQALRQLTANNHTTHHNAHGKSASKNDSRLFTYSTIALPLKTERSGSSMHCQAMILNEFVMPSHHRVKFFALLGLYFLFVLRLVMR